MRKAIILTGIIALAVVLGCFLHKSPPEIQYADVTLPSEGQALKEIRAQREQVKEELKEQGYPEELADTLLSGGAKRAQPIKNISGVMDKYGYPWNLPLNVGELELVSLYLIGNTDSEKFILGQYEDEAEESVIFVHMSKTAPISVLQASLSYKYEKKKETHIEYLTEEEDKVGFYFEVKLADGTNLKYVATSSKILPDTTIESFIGAVVDGDIIKSR